MLFSQQTTENKIKRKTTLNKRKQPGERSPRNPAIQVRLEEEDFCICGRKIYAIFLSNNEWSRHLLAEKVNLTLSRLREREPRKLVF